MENKQIDLGKELVRGVIDFNAEKFKGYPMGIFKEILASYGCKTDDEKLIMSDNIKTAERIELVLSRLGVDKARSLNEKKN